MGLNNLYLKLKSLNLSPDQLYLLHCINSRKEPINIKAQLEFKQLIKLELVSSDVVITPKGLTVLEEANKSLALGYSKPSEQINKLNENIDNYLNLFPKIKLPSGHYARASKKNIEGAFIWFFKNYDYSWDTILEATDRYLEEYEKNNYKFMRTSRYFIKKMEQDKTYVSQLADYCDVILSGTDECDQKFFGDNVI